MSDIKTTYNDIEIEYNVHNDKWVFTLDGKERSAQTLTNAKAAIDAPKPKDQKPFERFKAIHKTLYGSEKPKVVEVTSFVAGGFNGRYDEAWIVKEGKRHKVRISELFEFSDANQQVMKELAAIDAEQAVLNRKEEQKKKELKNIEPPKGE